MIHSYLSEEVAKGRVWEVGSAEEATALGVQCSPFGVIPKRGKPGKWRMTVDLSAPRLIA